MDSMSKSTLHVNFNTSESSSEYFTFDVSHYRAYSGDEIGGDYVDGRKNKRVMEDRNDEQEVVQQKVWIFLTTFNQDVAHNGDLGYYIN